MNDDPIERIVKEYPEFALDMAEKRGGFWGRLLAKAIRWCMKGDSKFSENFRKGFEKWRES